MPKRPRSHEIETQSRNSFRAAIPPVWVCRDVDQDYGIDLEIEIFDKSVATGEKFLVQLRATDESRLSRALAVRLTTDAIRYYRSLDLPVLIVRYHAPSDRLYCRWFHTHDPYYGRGGAKYSTFRIPEVNLWNAESPKLIRRELHDYRQVHQPSLQLPVVFSIRVDLPTTTPADHVSFLLRLRQALRDTEILDAVLNDPHHERAIHSLTIDATILDVRLAGKTGIGLHPPPGDVIAYDDRLIADAITAIGVAFDSFGHSVHGARLLWSAAAQSGLLKVEGGASLILRCFVRANQAHRAVELAAGAIEQGHSGLVQMLLGGALLLGEGMTLAERELCAVALERVAETAITSGDDLLAATLFYNLGRVLNQLERPRKVLGAYRKAARLYPDYAERNYFWRELGGLMFTHGRFGTAARFYRRALVAGADHHVACLLADALLFAGRYREALAQFEDSCDGGQPRHAEWRLKQRALTGLMKVCGIERQERDGINATAIMETAFNEESTCLAALSADALCGHAWFNLGVQRSQFDHKSEALDCFLLAAVSTEGDVEAWTNVVMLAFQLGELGMMEDTLAVANRFRGASFLSELHARMFSQFSDPADSTLIDELASALEAGTVPEEMRVRFHLEHGGFTEVIVPRTIPTERSI